MRKVISGDGGWWPVGLGLGFPLDFGFETLIGTRMFLLGLDNTKSYKEVILSQNVGIRTPIPPKNYKRVPKRNQSVPKCFQSAPKSS